MAASALASRVQGLSLSAKPTASAAPAAARLATFSGFKKVEGQAASLNVQTRSVRLSASTRQVVRAAVVAEPATIDVKDTSGASKGSETLQLKVADSSAKGLVHRYLVLVRQNARQGNASTKTRSEVRGGGKKPYGQKGTGNARRGSQRTPLRPGGGIIFGPKPRDWTIKMNKKERRLAMATAIQSAVDDMIVVEDLAGAFPDGKTKSMVAALKAWGVEDEHALLITKEDVEEVARVGSNIPNLTINNLGHGLSVYDVLRADKVIVEKSALAQINESYGAN